uniref:Uncharacterized protein n=1 Tax=Acrobeloides nanus TaxID=290746 RepID=A0A914CZM3_9BILA
MPMNSNMGGGNMPMNGNMGGGYNNGYNMNNNNNFQISDYISTRTEQTFESAPFFSMLTPQEQQQLVSMLQDGSITKQQRASRLMQWSSTLPSNAQQDILDQTISLPTEEQEITNLMNQAPYNVRMELQQQIKNLDSWYVQQLQQQGLISGGPLAMMINSSGGMGWNRQNSGMAWNKNNQN